uniref:Uncharacterized protein n=1 Tax=Plectus sambesii TaxID=2011161 RepID=A0A914VQ79_9BILA
MRSVSDSVARLVVAGPYQASLNTIVHGCTCTQPTGGCNEYNKTRSYALTEMIERRLDRQNYCYSLHHKSTKPFGREVFKKSDTCEGQYCFISLTTAEVIVESANFEENYEDHDRFIAMSRPRYELLAGCLKVDSDEKVQTGCFKEYHNASEPLMTHCICESHLCNYHHLLTGSQDSRRRTTDAPSPVTIIDGRPRPVPVENNDNNIAASSSPTAQSSSLVALLFMGIVLMCRLRVSSLC